MAVVDSVGMSEELPPSSPGGRKAEVSAETRAALLEAGAGLLREEPVGAVLSQLTARAVVDRAGRTTGAFFHHWPSQAAYQHDLLAYVLEPVRIQSTGEAVDAVLGGLKGGGDPIRVLGEAARGNFESVRADPFVPLWHALWARHGSDPYVRDLLRENMQWVTARVVPVIEAVVEASERRLRPPFTADDVAVLVTALVQGLSLRAAIEPERVPVRSAGDQDDDAGWDLVATTVTTLFEAITEPAGD
jgi:AcrR family transcriptional regulator